MLYGVVLCNGFCTDGTLCYYTVTDVAHEVYRLHASVCAWLTLILFIILDIKDQSEKHDVGRS